MMHVITRVLTQIETRSWLRHCTTNRKVAVSIPDSVIGMSTRNSS
jgi:hypothetical protein